VHECVGQVIWHATGHYVTETQNKNFTKVRSGSKKRVNSSYKSHIFSAFTTALMTTQMLNFALLLITEEIQAWVKVNLEFRTVFLFLLASQWQKQMRKN
jgi:hypothetical protein